MSKKRPDFKTFKKKASQDAEFKKEYEALKPEFDLIRKFIKARQNAHVFRLKLIPA